MDTLQLENHIKESIREYFKIKEFKNNYKVPLSESTILVEDIIEAVDSLLNLRLTMSDKVRKFEEEWAAYNNTKHSILLNSGTSANFLALSILTNKTLKNRMNRGAEVITSPVTFPSSVFPIPQNGLVPVFVDVDLETMNIDPSKIETAITPKTKAILPVHFMGMPCDMKAIMEIAEKHDLFVIEDACEAHGAQVDNKKVGTFGDMGTHSFFFSHHIATGEGGSIITENETYAELAHCLKSYGWVRNMRKKDELSNKYRSVIDPRHLYVNIGYNLKPTEITAALGLHQISKIEEVIDHKRNVARQLNAKLSEFEDVLFLPHDKTGTKHTYLGYPIVIRSEASFDKFDMMNYLEKNSIETRQLEAGNMLQQPSIALFKHRVVGEIKNSKTIMRGGFFIGDHMGMDKEQIEYITTTISNFIESRPR